MSTTPIERIKGKSFKCQLPRRVDRYERLFYVTASPNSFQSCACQPSVKEWPSHQSKNGTPPNQATGSKLSTSR
ncbi:hypothetical protein BGZ61DRAFT_163735 [Ilyonectria robusta]|uniref:uncharacterized protein n=1 Tax=Ilyonectria robusta TaxID=1079257 RepID=UPI001E8D92EC|nr:uncharacterized protein BGZ61DRAFT_163735 [Ilyonectria robusta]KAH8733630.1 hypothetical protein BGZ61DRAFT_163735 [Ilyonectria robusta]